MEMPLMMNPSSGMFWPVPGSTCTSNYYNEVKYGFHMYSPQAVNPRRERSAKVRSTHNRWPQAQQENLACVKVPTIRLPIRFYKDSAELLVCESNGPKLQMRFRFAAEVPTRVYLSFLANNSAAYPALGVVGQPSPVMYRFDEGGSELAVVHTWGPEEISEAALLNPPSGVHPLVVRIEFGDRGPGQGSASKGCTDPGSSQRNPEADKEAICLSVFITFSKSANGRWSLSVSQQKLWAQNTLYRLQDVYGATESSTPTGRQGKENARYGGQELAGSGMAPRLGDADGGEVQSVLAAQPSQEASLLDMKDSRAPCVVCLDAARDCVLLPCRHWCLCHSCAVRLRSQSPTCPVCRGPLKTILQMNL